MSEKPGRNRRSVLRVGAEGMWEPTTQVPTSSSPDSWPVDWTDVFEHVVGGGEHNGLKAGVLRKVGEHARRFSTGDVDVLA